MVKNGKAKGTLLENDIKHIFIYLGWEAGRGAASLGTDVTAMRHGVNLLISCKWLRSYFKPEDRRKVIETARIAGGIPLLAYKVYEEKDVKKRKGRRAIEVCIGESNRLKGAVLFLEPLGYYGTLDKRLSEQARVEQFLEKEGYRPPPCTPPEQ